MQAGFESKGIFKKYFEKQLISYLSLNIFAETLNVDLILPGNHRFPYIDKVFLASEFESAFEVFFPLGCNIISITPSSNDDHYIKVVAIPKKT